MRLFILGVFSLAIMAGCKAAHRGAAKLDDQKSAEKITCHFKSEQRDIEIRKKGSACEVYYKKGGELKNVASGVNGSAHCNEVVKKMRAKLEAAGWACK